MILKDGLSVNIRTQEECNAFIEVGIKEGLIWYGGSKLNYSNIVGNSIQIGMFNTRQITRCHLNYTSKECPNLVEASELLHNHIISRRLKL